MVEGQPIFEGEIHVKDNRIAYVGTNVYPESCENIDQKGSAITEIWDREIDARYNLIMPGFKNAHTHSAMTFLRSYADDMPLGDWLDKQVFPREAKLTPEDV